MLHAIRELSRIGRYFIFIPIGVWNAVKMISGDFLNMVAIGVYYDLCNGDVLKMVTYFILNVIIIGNLTSKICY